VRERLVRVRAAIAAACGRVGRDPATVGVVVVTKGFPAEVARAAFEAGAEDLGENYVQELRAKREAAPGARWHFLGTVQANKARAIAECHLVHGLEPGHGATRLGRVGAGRGTPVRCLAEVDFTGRRQGASPDGLPAFLETLRSDPGIDLRGLMTVAPPGSAEEARRAFADLRALRDRLGPDLPELSMGMSGDYPVAVEEGATMVRIGTAVLGERRDD